MLTSSTRQQPSWICPLWILIAFCKKKKEEETSIDKEIQEQVWKNVRIRYFEQLWHMTWNMGPECRRVHRAWLQQNWKGRSLRVAEDVANCSKARVLKVYLKSTFLCPYLSVRSFFLASCPCRWNLRGCGVRGGQRANGCGQSRKWAEWQTEQ